MLPGIFFVSFMLKAAGCGVFSRPAAPDPGPAASCLPCSLVLIAGREGHLRTCRPVVCVTGWTWAASNN